MQKRNYGPNWQRWANLLAPAHLRLLLVAILAILLVAGLHPFNFFPKNRVTWLPQEPGILFHGYGQTIGSSPLASPPRLTAVGQVPEVTIELWVASLDQGSEINDILSVYQSHDREPFAIEQSEARLLVGGLFRNAQGQRKFQRIAVNGVFVPGARRFITITNGPQGCGIYLEGTLQSVSPGLILESENFDGSLLLGQTARGRQDWRGAVFGLAFYRNEFTPSEVATNYETWRRRNTEQLRSIVPESAIYAFDEAAGTIVHNRGNLGGDLTIPKRLRPIDPVILETPSRHDLLNLSDVSLNILGFVPFGLPLVMYLKGSRNWSNLQASTATISAGFLVSLVIELLQVFLPTRDSSLLDLINNTLGTGIGVGLGLAIWQYFPGPRKSPISNAGARIGWRWER